MDPTTNSTPNLTPTPGFDPNAAPNPAPVSPEPQVGGGQVLGLPQVDPTLFTTTPAEPTAPAAPMMGTMPAEPAQTMETMSVPSPAQTMVGAAPADVPNPAPAAEPMQAATESAMPAFSATDPLTMPEQPKAPDPVEEELKAPLKAAEPVPGSIGSAVSVSSDGVVENVKPTVANMFSFGAKKNTAHTPSVAFNDPAAVAEQRKANAPAKPASKKMNKNTMIIIGVLGAVIVVALAAILIMQLNS